MKAMISQPLGGLTEKQISDTRNKATKYLESLGYEVVNTLFKGEEYETNNLIKKGIKQIPLYFLSKSLETMSNCHVVYFTKGWADARSCKIEHRAAKAYGLTIIYESTLTYADNATGMSAANQVLMPAT